MSNTPSKKNAKIRKVSIDYFIPDKDVTEAHVLAVFGRRTLNMSKAQLDELRLQVRSDKKDVVLWARMRIKEEIVSNLRKLGVAVDGWNHMLNIWSEDGSLPMAAKMWSACYGMFDEQNDWARQLGGEYMKLRGFEYDETHTDKNPAPKGCFAKLVSHCKSYCIKQVNRMGQRSHGTVIRVRRTQEERLAGGRYRKRKKGSALGGFAIINGEKKYNPDKIIDNEEAGKQVSDIDFWR